MKFAFQFPLAGLFSRRALLLAFAFTLQASPALSQAPMLTSVDAALSKLLAEALSGNAEIRAARSEMEAARQRIAPAGALDDPMLEAGFLNVPATSWRLNREDMTMKMLGISQRLPAAGKRALRREVASRDAEAVEQAYQEAANRVARDLRLAYYDLGLASESARLIRENRSVLEQFQRIAESRYSAGQGTQADVLKAQTQLARMSEELLRMEREIPMLEAELARLLGRRDGGAPILAVLPPVQARAVDFAVARDAALGRRPQLLALQKLVDKATTSMDLARKDANPDVDLRFSYGQRDRTPDGLPRSDVFSVTVAINLPVWSQDKTQPRIAESRALLDQAMSLYQAQQNEAFARLRQQLAIAEQSRRSLQLYEDAILPQARLAVESTLASYRVSRADMLTLLDSQMGLYGYGIGRVTSVAVLHKAYAEIDFITGAPLQ